MTVKWTENQSKIHDLKKYRDGKIIVKACPGSGKTLCVSERIIKFIKQHEPKHQGLAITSFTNVAVEEIKNNYEARTSEKISYPHYIGTFDSFINKFIFLPYGHLVMKCNKRPLLVGEPYHEWYHNTYKYKCFDKITYDINEKIKKIDQKVSLENLEQCKKDMHKKGFAIQDDANYFSMKILKKYSSISKLLISKFPYFIIDEAQDLSEIQMEIINILIENGLKNILLVGDPNQAIFEWKGAKPELFNDKFIEWNEEYNTGIELEDTFRCSENISSYLSKLSKTTIKSSSDHSLNLKPKIIPHENDYKKIIKEFIKKVKNHLGKDIENEKIAILFRSKNELNKTHNKNISNYELQDIFKNIENDIKEYKADNNIIFTNESDIQNYTANILKGEHYFLNNRCFEGFKEFEEAYVKLKNKKVKNINKLIRESIEKNGLYKHRLNVWQFIKSFEKPTDKNQLIEDWIDQNNNKMKKESVFQNKTIYLNKIKTSDKNSGTKLNKELTWKMLSINNTKTDSKVTCGTIHSVKGKTFDAVLIILNNTYKNNFKKKLSNDEELRIIYVGMSRARVILEIAVPQKDIDEWETFFEQPTLDNFL